MYCTKFVQHGTLIAQISEREFLLEKVVAIGVEAVDAIVLEIDLGIFKKWRSLWIGASAKILQDAQSVHTFLAGMDEKVLPLEVASQWRPKVIGLELQAEEIAHRGFYVVFVKFWEHGICVPYFVKGFGRIERITL